MIRRLFITAAMLSLLLFVATVGLWIRSHWVADQVSREWADPPHPNPHPDTRLIPPLLYIIDSYDMVICNSFAGSAELLWWHHNAADSDGSSLRNRGWTYGSDSTAGSQHSWSLYWFDFSCHRYPSGFKLHINLPYWTLAIVWAAFAALFARNWLVRRPGPREAHISALLAE